MSSSLVMGCTCGHFRATIEDATPQNTSRNVCCCSSCQAYAHHLERADEILDQDGGTEVFQISPATLHITKGEDALACMQLTPKGALRWYASCCHTPIANTLLSGTIPFMAVHHLAIDEGALDAPIEAYFGPLRVTVNGHFSKAEARQRKATSWDLLKMLMHLAPLFFTWLLRGDGRRSPFFHSDTTLPLVPPRRPDGVLASEATPPTLLAPKAKKVGCG